MSPILPDTSAASPSGPIRNVDPGDVVGRPRLIPGVSISVGDVVFLFAPIPSASIDSGPLSPTDLEFWLEKRAFEAIPRTHLTQYEGMFVASHNGRIVDSDAKLEVLTDRFFTRFGDVPVYMTKSGEGDDDLRIDTPFFE